MSTVKTIGSEGFGKRALREIKVLKIKGMNRKLEVIIRPKSIRVYCERDERFETLQSLRIYR
jgi:hypothetical protein